MLRSQYKSTLKKCQLSKEQRQALLCIVENCFSSARDALQNDASIQPLFNDGLADGINSMCRFLYGDLLAHDEFEDEHAGHSFEHPVLTLGDIPCNVNAVNALEAVTRQAVKHILAALSQEQAIEFISAMRDLAKPRLYHFAERRDKGLEHAYFTGKAAWWIALFHSVDN